MKKVLLGVILGVLGMYAWNRTRPPRPVVVTSPAHPDDNAVERTGAAPPVTPHYQCDGRKYCSQMTSCEEAMFFLHNCPGAKMDGDGDGIPCEEQWCVRQ